MFDNPIFIKHPERLLLHLLVSMEAKKNCALRNNNFLN
jgi:hypothetical protein